MMENHTYKAEVALIVGGSTLDQEALTFWANQLRCEIFAADSGFLHLKHAGLPCKAVIGDMDSLPGEVAKDLPPETDFCHIADQDTTDFEKLLSKIDCRHMLGFGFMDGQFDHALSVLTVCAKYAHTHHIVLVGQEDCMLVTRHAVRLKTASNCRFSIWPVGKVEMQSSSGLFWAVDNLILSSWGQTGTSNRTNHPVQTIYPSSKNDAAYAIIMDKKWVGQLLKAEFNPR